MSDWWTYNDEQERADDFGDGYRNEFQRCHAESSMNADRGERNKANLLVAAGRFVLVAFHPLYCKVTDGCIGDYVSVRFDAATRAEVEAYQSARPIELEDDGRTEVWPLLPPAPAAPVTTFLNADIDECPF